MCANLVTNHTKPLTTVLAKKGWLVLSHVLLGDQIVISLNDIQIHLQFLCKLSVKNRHKN